MLNYLIALWKDFRDPMPTISARTFLKNVGSLPMQDDLDRCNCTQVGEIGHADCGWNEKYQKPTFMVPIKER